MKANACPIVSASQLEQYLMNLLPAQIGGSIYDESVTMIEDHLLVCPICLDRAEIQHVLTVALRESLRVSSKLAKTTNGR
jgi:hypothetical protein